MTKPTEQEIEHVARAMCEAMDENPDVTDLGDGLPVHWAAYRNEAIRFLAGHYAMKEWQ